MRKLSLLLLLVCATITTQAAVDEALVLGNEYHVYTRSHQGSAVNPVTHTTCVPQDGYLETAWFDGSTVYIKNIVYGSDREFGDYWVEGQFDGEHIIVPLGQVVYEETPSGFYAKSGRRAVLAWGTVHYNAATGTASFSRNAAVSQVSYLMDDNTILIENTSGPIAMNEDEPYLNITLTSQKSYDATGLAIVWEDGETDEWAGYMEWGTLLDTAPILIDKQPEGELKTYTRTSDCFRFSGATYPTLLGIEHQTSEGYIVFANDGKTVYLKDPVQSMMYDTWIRGSINTDGTIITVPVPQKIYLYKNRGIQSVTIQLGDISMGKQTEGWDFADLYVSNSGGYNYAVFTIKDNTITLSDSWTNFIEPANENFYACGFHAFDPVTNQGVVEANVVYAMSTDTQKTGEPTIKGTTMDNGRAYLVEIVEAEPSTIFYRVQYPNGQFTDWTKYVDDLSFTSVGEYRIEAYAQADGKLPSNTVFHEFEITKPTGVNEMAAGKQVVGTRYFNVMGQEIQRPDGLTIIVNTYSDGSSTAVKVVK